MFGYSGKIALVDLSKKDITYKEFKEGLYREVLGGRGLAAYLFYHLIKPGIDPLSPGNAIIVSSGPVNGTITPLASKIGFFFKSPMTNAWGESYVGGSIPPALKWGNLDAMIIMGKSEEPVYLYVSEDRIEILSAKNLWGLSVYETEDALREKHGKHVIIASVGPAGENLVRFAAIMNDKWRAAGRTGGGAVMGSKKLKAIVFDVTRKVYSVAKEEEFMGLVRDLLKQFRESEGVQRMREFGTAGLTITANEMGFFPTKYWSMGSMENWESIGAHSIKEILVRPHACYNCPIACGRLVKIHTKWGDITLDGLEYETVDTLGGQLLIDDLSTLVYLNELADKYGLDTISLGNVLAFAIEAYKRGKIKTKIDYNDPDGAVHLVEKIVYREGDGALLADGVARASKTLGLEDIAVHVKGVEPPAYDPRRLKGMILGLGTSPRGACHLRMMAYYIDLKGLGGGPGSTSREKIEILVEFEDFMSSFDSLILCKFGRDIFRWDIMVKLVNYITGFDYSIGEYKKLMSRITTLVRLINTREGLNREHDKLPKRLVKEAIEHKGQIYKIDETEMEKMLNDYYELRGYDENGVPREETLNRLGVTKLIEAAPF
ncbi:MAG: aldehyde ferredoxin oxidoreductase family protein [Candidatus Njordarchaeia archaeon]